MKVLALTASGLHLGYVGCYGSDWVTTPTLDRLAAEGIVFDQHYADCPEPAAARPARRFCAAVFLYDERFFSRTGMGPHYHVPDLFIKTTAFFLESK